MIGPVLRPLTGVLALVLCAGTLSSRPVQAGQMSPASTTIRAARLIDGRGRRLAPAVVEVRGRTIVAVDQRKGPVTTDLGDVTLLPGLIDVHVHLNWYFGPNGHYQERNVPPEYPAKAIAENLRVTLMAGFTTVQSVGWAGDKALREGTAAGTMIGPRILTSLGQIQPGTRTADQLREQVKQLKANGADLIKIFASASTRDGGKMNVTRAQLDALCGEAKAQGLRTLVHAQDSESVIASVDAGCTEIEHGSFADDLAIRRMADAHVYFDPNIGLVLQNYFENKDRFMGTGNYDEAGFASMAEALPLRPIIFKKALAAGIEMPLGTDAVAGAHGQNAREIIARVKDGGQPPMDAITAATSLSAESLGLATHIGTLAAGYEADMIAVAGDPTTDITTLRNAVFVMKSGTIYKR